MATLPRLQAFLDRQFRRLSHADTPLEHALLGLLVGLAAGSVVLLFRLAIEAGQALVLPGDATHYAALTPRGRVALLLGGAAAILLAFRTLRLDIRQLGVVHVMESLAVRRARLPLNNAVGQFLGATIAIVSGYSVGREGPAIHLGSAVGSQIAISLRLPNNSVRILLACGCAGAVAAFFNTPLAAVVLTMEVVMMEYALTGLAPVIIAAVAGTTITRLAFDAGPLFPVPSVGIVAFGDLLLMIILGLVVGGLAALFQFLLRRLSGVLPQAAVWQRLSLAFAGTALIAVFVPEAMSLGYESTGGALRGDGTLLFFAVLALAKLAATTIALGFGVPGGLIGPTLVIGASAGAAVGLALNLLGLTGSSAILFATVGMGAMMGATLQAPLAALTAMLEMTANPNIILPGMLGVMSAALVNRVLFGNQPIFTALAAARGFHYPISPLEQTLESASVTALADPSFALLAEQGRRQALDSTLSAKPRWLLVHDGETPIYASICDDAAMTAAQNGESSAAVDGPDAEEPRYHLRPEPAQRLPIVRVAATATLREANQAMRDAGAPVAFVQADQARGLDGVYGLLTAESVRSFRR